MTASSRAPLPGEGSTPSAEDLAQINAVLDVIPMAVMAHTLDYLVVAANRLSQDVIGCDVEDMLGRRVAEFVPEADRPSARTLASELTSHVGTLDRPIGSLRRVLRTDGGIVSCWMHVGTAVIAGHRLIIACMDLVNPVVSDAHRWRIRAERDDLTGLWRRGPFVEHVNEWVSTGRSVMLAFVDVDRLKTINDNHGHPAGDLVLEATASKLLRWAPPSSLVGRFSGDEFVVAVPDIESGDTPFDWAESIRDAVSGAPVPWQRQLLTVSVSVGAVERRDGEDSGALIARADARMYLDKVARGAGR